MSEVGIAELRQALKSWIARVQGGDEVVITERGKPVARLTAVGVPTVLDQLVAEGRLSLPTQSRPSARNVKRVEASGPTSGYVTHDRDGRRQ